MKNRFLAGVMFTMGAFGLVWQTSHPAMADATYSATVLADSPIAYWRMDDVNGSATVDDATGHGHPLTVNSRTAFGLGAPGLIAGDTSTSADDAGTYGFRADAALNLSSGTYEAWFKMTSSCGGGCYRDLVIHNTTSPPDGFGLLVGDNVLGAYDNGAGAVRSTGVNVADNTIHHAVFVWSMGGTSKVYLDGVEKVSFILSSDVHGANTGGNLTVGGSTNATQSWVGPIDEVAVYGAMLTPSQVLAHYNAGMAPPPPPPTTTTTAPPPTTTTTAPPPTTTTVPPTTTTTAPPPPAAPTPCEPLPTDPVGWAACQSQHDTERMRAEVLTMGSLIVMVLGAILVIFAWEA